MLRRLFLFFFLVPYSLIAQSLAREPYLQRVSDNTVIIRWRTDSATNSRVRYGLTANNLSNVIDDPSVSIEHRVEVSGLSADTKYYYSVGSTSAVLAGSSGIDDSYYFLTNPVPGSDKSTRVWVLGDSGRGNAGAYSVKQGYLNFISSSKKADLLLMLGDNAYNNGLDNEYDTGLFDVYPDILKNTVLWPTLGNHDGYAVGFAPYNSGQEIPYYASFSLPRSAEVGGVSSGTEAYYSFDYANIHFICLNSYSVDRSESAAMASWLKQDLSATDKTWKIAFWHHPPYSKGSHNSDTEIELIEMRENIVPILEDNGVDLVLAGHSHTYERSFLIDGHYGKTTAFSSDNVLDFSSGEEAYHKPPQSLPHMGAVYVVNGVGATADAGAGTMNHPIMYTSLVELGSMILDIDGADLTANFIDVNGSVVDTFRISKSLQSSYADSQKNLNGSVIGSLENVNNIDGALQYIKAKKRRKIYRANTVYHFKIPDYFSEKHLYYRAYKKSKKDQNFNMYISTDNTKFSSLTTISSGPANINTNHIELSVDTAKDIYIKIKTRGGARKYRRARLLVDQLVIAND